MSKGLAIGEDNPIDGADNASRESLGIQRETGARTDPEVKAAGGFVLAGNDKEATAKALLGPRANCA